MSLKHLEEVKEWADYDEVLSVMETLDLLREHGHGVQSLNALADDVGVLLSEDYNDGGEVFTYGIVMEWLGY